ncbi:cation transporting ATPase C-terminal domain-containing protein [Streptomyces sp. DSM 116496]|uniref:cation transporting ATPase C-terminal domain-containing protein n=1 Tax=Streptomyces stoeckheimensis TaxID=3344656 RepID=UPI0038B25F22
MVLSEPPEVLDQARLQAAQLAVHGFRVLAVAGAERLQWSLPAAEAENGLSLLGLIAISDPPKATAATTLAGRPLARPCPPSWAGQILWINLLTHGLTGVAMGAEPASPEAMRRPPRPPGQHILAAGVWQRLLILAAAVTAFSLIAGIGARSMGLPWQSVLFLSLLGAQLGVALGLRARLLTTQNLSLPAAVAASALLAMAALHLPALQSLLDAQPVGRAGIGLAAAAALAAFAAARLLRGAFHRKA